MKSLWEKEGVRGRDQKTQFQPKGDHCPIKLPTLLHFSNINSHLHRVAEHNSQSLLREGADFEALNNGQGQVSVLWLMSRPWTNTRNSADWGEDGFQVHVIISRHLQAHARECFFWFLLSFTGSPDNNVTKLQCNKQLRLSCSVHVAFIYVLNTLNLAANERAAGSGTRV